MAATKVISYNNWLYAIETSGSNAYYHNLLFLTVVGYKFVTGRYIKYESTSGSSTSTTISTSNTTSDKRKCYAKEVFYGGHIDKITTDTGNPNTDDDPINVVNNYAKSNVCAFIDGDGKTNIYVFPTGGQAQETLKVTYYDPYSFERTASFEYDEQGFYYSGALDADDTDRFTIEAESTPIVEPTINNNIEYTEISYTGGNPYALTLTANDGYKFGTSPTATYVNSDGEAQTDTFQLSEDNKTATLTTATVDSSQLVITINGSVTPETVEPTITNNIANTTATYSGSNHQYVITVKANDGYLLDGTPEASYIGYSSGTTVSVSFAVASDMKSASGVCPDVDENTPIVLTGNTKEEVEITVVNNITNTTETHTFDGTTFAVTVKGKYPKYRFKTAQVEYTDSDGNTKTVDMQTSIVDEYPQAEAQVTGVKNNTTVNINGTFENATMVTTELSNCTVDSVPPYLFGGDSWDVVVTANNGTVFDTCPMFETESEAGDIITQELTLSADNKTATGTFANPTYTPQYVRLYATATPETVIGGNYGAIHVYKVTLDNLEAFSKKRFFKEAINSDGTEFTLINLGDYVNRIKRVFFTVPTASTDVIKCGNYNTGVECEAPQTDTVTLNFGAITVPTPNGDATDYLSELKLFVPFSGFVSVPVDYIGKTLSLVYTVNVITGGGVAKLLCGEDIVLLVDVEPNEDIIYQTNLDNLATVGGDEWNEKLLYGVEPFLQVRYYDSLNKEERNNDYVNAKLGDMRGFCVVDDVTLSTTAEMTADEQERIITLLKQGVYIEQ